MKTTLKNEWEFTLSNPDIWLERFFAILCLPRLLWLLPIPQAQFSKAVAAFTDIVPQWVWAIWSFGVFLVLWRATAHPFHYAPRISAVKALGIHWIVLGTLYFLGEPRATGGYFYFLACLGPLVVHTYLTARHSKGGST